MDLDWDMEEGSGSERSLEYIRNVFSLVLINAYKGIKGHCASLAI